MATNSIENKVPIRVYQFLPSTSAPTSIALVAEVDDYETAYFGRGIITVEGFSIVINKNKTNAQYFQRGRLIQWGTDSRKIGYIVECDLVVDDTGKGGEELTVSGFEAKYIFGNRILYPQYGQAKYIYAGAAETVIKKAVTDHCGASPIGYSSATDTNRAMARLTINSDQARGSSYTMSARLTNLQDELLSVSKSTYLGYYVGLNLNTSQIYLEVIPGVDRTVSQSTNPRAIFSTDYNTLQSANLTDSETEYKNYALVGGTGEGTARNIALVYLDSSPPADVYRKEVFYDVRNYATADLSVKGQGELTKVAVTVYVEGAALPASTLRLGTDFDLGDIVTFQRWGYSTNSRLTAIKENIEHGSYSIDFTIGKPYPELTLEIDQEYNNIQSITNSTEIA
jgi:hypothetical protein